MDKLKPGVSDVASGASNLASGALDLLSADLGGAATNVGKGALNLGLRGLKAAGATSFLTLSALRAFAHGERVREFQAFARQAYKRLEILEAAPSKEALMLLPSNRFEALGGDRIGQYSIRINDKWRICFEWSEEEPHTFNIEIVDYH